ncbi:hypothetical protein AVEN_116344-1 [Araneus ventricosus]|uniref:Uncharacterized protein n=1 Tax=Araneus ventricosus TaxID=182803 RepID=A0A4Y2LFP0_ARAVE|nr:hypothetical protein AVEN_116344-1 [Araneus ventricosus]
MAYQNCLQLGDFSSLRPVLAYRHPPIPVFVNEHTGRMAYQNCCQLGPASPKAGLVTVITHPCLRQRALAGDGLSKIVCNWPISAIGSCFRQFAIPTHSTDFDNFISYEKLMTFRFVIKGACRSPPLFWNKIEKI